MQRAVGARAIQQRLAGHVNALPIASWVLDIGGGTGTLGSALDSRSDYVCLDLDAARLRSFQHRHRHARCLVADAAEVPIATGRVGTVVCSAVSHHLDDELFGSMIREARRVLRADGRLVFMDAVWAPRRWSGRVLWRYDQGSHPARPRHCGYPWHVISTSPPGRSSPSCIATWSPSPRHAANLRAFPRMRTDCLRLLAGARNLERVDDWLWRSPSIAPVSYPKTGSATCASLEEGSFWFEHRNGCITHALQSYPPGGIVLDVGGGNGVVARHLEQNGFPTLLLEPSSDGVYMAQARGLSPHCPGNTRGRRVFAWNRAGDGFVRRSRTLRARFDLLRLAQSLIIPEGRIYLTVPAFNWLWSSEDEHAGHHRRYLSP